MNSFPELKIYIFQLEIKVQVVCYVDLIQWKLTVIIENYSPFIHLSFIHIQPPFKASFFIKSSATIHLSLMLNPTVCTTHQVLSHV